MEYTYISLISKTSSTSLLKLLFKFNTHKIISITEMLAKELPIPIKLYSGVAIKSPRIAKRVSSIL